MLKAKLKNSINKSGILGCFILINIISGAQTPAPYSPSIPVNFIRTWDATAPEADGNTLMTRQLKDVKMNTQYFDGLGRPIQTVMKQGSLETGSSAADFVSASFYDEFGREQYKYLPFAANNTNGNIHINDGLFKLNPFEQQATFMSSQYLGQSESYYYSKTNFESSPLNRVEKTMAPGINWVGSNRGVEAKYWVNTIADEVRIWNVADVTNGFGNYSSPGTYAAGELFKIVMVDEHQKQVIEFKDKEGKVILKKVQLTAAVDNGNGANHVNWLCTYYIYDDMSRLRCVIQPRGVELINPGWQLTDAMILSEQCFRYEYDQGDRMIKKKVPGAGEVWMVYDARDRLVMTQDANMRSSSQKKWMYTTYDDLNRPVSTGLLTDPSNYNNHSYHLSAAYNSTAYPDLGYYSYEELTKTFYDNYTWLGSYGFPVSSSYNTVYDTYFQAVSNTQWPYAQANTPTTELKGLTTGSRIKILGTGTYLYTVSFYDAKGRVIQVQNTNITGGTDIATTQYTWAGQPLVVISKQEKQGINAQTTVTVSQMTYDDLGRLVKTEKKLSNTLVSSGTMSAYKTIVENEYDKLGQLKKKKLAPQYNSNAGLETQNYEYNIRGWMLGINRDYAKDANNNNFFGFDLGYDKTSNGLIGNQSYANPQYNGNIEGMVWKSKGDGEKRKYDFYYDAANRLTSADFNQYTSSSFNKTAGFDFSVTNLTFDANGNILTMNQKGWKVGGSNFIDQLQYNYYSNSNRLKNVIDGSNDVNTKLGDFRSSSAYMTSLGGNKTTSAVDYSYDDNGNLKKDLNKDIGTASQEDIIYNHLNLPQTITVRNANGTIKGTITYTYDAAGNKLKKEVNETGQALKTTLYQGGIVYENDALQFLAHEEGRIRPLSSGGEAWAYDYLLKDHLGNVRMVLTDEVKSDAYPPLSFEGNSGSEQVVGQDTYWENANGQSINVVNVRTAGVSGFNGATGNGSYVRLVRKSTTSIGATKFLKVMAGDRIHASVEYFYTAANTDNSTATPLSSFVNSLIGSFANTGTAGSLLKNESTAITTQLSSNNLFTGLLNTAPSTSGSNQAPKAYLNILFFDDQFKFDETNSVVLKVAYTPNVKGTLSRNFSNAITANKNGYVYIYFTNESDALVYFDNFNLTQERGRVLEENHYYPYGLTMAGISSKALAFGGPENKYKFNDGTELSNKEFSDGSGLELYETPFRGYDPQIGRFWQIDAMADDYEAWSPYVFSYDNPIYFNDPSGLKPNDPEKPVVTPASYLQGVTVTAKRKKWKYSDWALFADINKRKDVVAITNYLKEHGASDDALRLFNIAWNNIGYRERLAEIEKAWRDFVQGLLVEGATWVAGGYVLKIGGKLVSLGYREYQIYKRLQAARKALEATKTGGRAFFSGAGTEARAIEQGYQTLGQTRAGRNLQNLIDSKNIPWKGPGGAEEMWKRLSSVWAKGIPNGSSVPVFLNNPRAGSIWFQTELPILQSKGVNLIYK